ncbi:MAG: HAMP domain-containing protein [Leptospiraceae bacterium]|nr:HAMP domain-containing protein [Leptospiraceae bacterium]
MKAGSGKFPFRWKLMIVVSTLAVSATGITAYLIFSSTQTMILDVMGGRLMDIARTSVNSMTREDRDAIRFLNEEIRDKSIQDSNKILGIAPGDTLESLEKADSARLMKTDQFQRLVTILRNIKKSTVRISSDGKERKEQESNIKYAYMFVPVPQSKDHKILRFLADADYDTPDWENPIANLYGVKQSSFIRAFDGFPSAEDEFIADKWGTWLSAAVPIKDRNGDTIAILGLDYDATGEANKVRDLFYICVFSVVASLILALFLSYLLASFMSRPIAKLQDGALRVKERDYDTRVDVKTNDELGVLADTFNSMVEEIRAYSDYLQALNASYYRFVPREFLQHLGQESILNIRLGDQIQKEMTVLFSDIRSFTTISESLRPSENFNFLNSYLKQVGPVIRNSRGFIDKYIGDAIMALFPDAPKNAVEAAINMRLELLDFNEYRKKKGYQPIDIGVGLHTGVLMLGTIGEEERMESTVIADAVNLASRLEGLTKKMGSHIIVSEATLRQALEDMKINYRFMGKVRVKGKTRSVPVYEVLDGDPAELVDRKVAQKERFEQAVMLYHKKRFTDAEALFLSIYEAVPEDKAARIYLDRCKKYFNTEQDDPVFAPGDF